MLWILKGDKEMPIKGSVADAMNKLQEQFPDIFFNIVTLFVIVFSILLFLNLILDSKENDFDEVEKKKESNEKGQRDMIKTFKDVKK